MRKIIGYIQILIFIVFGILLLSCKFQSETSSVDAYWIAGVIYLLLAILLFVLGNKYCWFKELPENSGNKTQNFSGFTIPLVFVIGTMSYSKTVDDLLNIDSISPFMYLAIPLATILGYTAFLAQSTMRPWQFKGTLYKKALVPALYIGTFFLAFSLILSGNQNLPSDHNETRTYTLVDNDCDSKYISVATDSGVRELYNPQQKSTRNCADATKVKVNLNMNNLGIDYFSAFEYIK